MPDFSYENRAHENGFALVCGVDEAGRGPLAGPVCAAAVILPENCDIQGINDSKKLSEKTREHLYGEITKKAIAYYVAYGTRDEIESVNILNATFLAMNRAVDGLAVRPDFVLVDGNRAPKGMTLPLETVVKGDAKSISVAAASILAKVTRDRLMAEYDLIYPQYGFKKHKGYGTKDHITAIRTYGASPVHRPSFLTKI